MNSDIISIWASPPKKSPSKNTSPLKELLQELELERARNALNSQKKQDDSMARKAHIAQNNEDALLSSKFARIAQAAQSTHVASLDARNAEKRLKSLERSSFDLWKKVPTEAERKVLDEKYPEGWYLNKFEKVCPLQVNLGLTKEKIAHLWECFPAGWYLGDYNSIHVCPGAIAERTFITAQQVTEMLDSGDFLKELQKLQLDVDMSLRYTIRKKGLHTALTKISKLFKNTKYPLPKEDIYLVYEYVKEASSVFPINFIPNNSRVPTKISPYVELYISLRRIKMIIERKNSQPF